MDGDFYLRHGAKSDPGGHGPAIDGLPSDAGALCAVLDPAGLTTRAASGTVEVALAVDGPRYARLWARTVLG